jgi:hypothetical protein
MDRARQALAAAGKVTASHVSGEVPPSFLQALAALLESPDRPNGRYIYSGRPYQIRVTRSADVSSTAYFRERRLIGPDVEVIRVSGHVRREAGGKETEFRLWIANCGERPLPLRIEYQPKSYLRLIFEAAIPG